MNEGAGKLLKKLNVEAKDNDFSKSLRAGADKKEAELKALNGEAFDRAYAANELAYHQTVNKVVGENLAARCPERRTQDLPGSGADDVQGS